MKITAPKDPDECFRQTEHAVKHSYDGLGLLRIKGDRLLFDHAAIETPDA